MCKQASSCGAPCSKHGNICAAAVSSAPATEPDTANTLETAKAAAHRALDAAERAWYAYAGLCDVGPERSRAFDVYENVRCARRV